jgi:hypothetical protein
VQTRQITGKFRLDFGLIYHHKKMLNKGRAVSSDDCDLVATFTGNHGWFWRNRGEADVQLVLCTRGDYRAIERVK